MLLRMIPAALMAASLLAGCTYQANVAPSTAAAASVVPAKRVNSSVSYYVAPDLASLRRSASEGYMCSAHDFPVDAGPAIDSSIKSINAAAFAGDATVTNTATPAPGVQRHLNFQLDSFMPRLRFETGFWSATALANVELTIRVNILDALGTMVGNALLAGTGYAESDGGCPEGAKVLEEATNQAIKRAMEDYVAKVINSGQLEPPPPVATVPATTTP